MGQRTARACRTQAPRANAPVICALASAFITFAGAYVVAAPAGAQMGGATAGATPPPVSGRRLSAPESILPADVLARVELLRENVP